MATETFPGKPQSAEEFDPAWLRDHVENERRNADLLSGIREVLFGAQDGLISVLAVVSAVASATGRTFDVLVAGLASMLAGVFAMGLGEFISSKSQREIFEAQIAMEEAEVDSDPRQAEAEVAF